MNTCDVAVAGGGPAGATVGRILAGWGFTVIVISAPDATKVGEVMGPEANKILEALELTALFSGSSEPAARCEGVIAQWPSMESDRTDHVLRGSYGWTVDRRRLARGLRQIAQANGCVWIDGAVTDVAVPNESEYILSVNSGRQSTTIAATFVIDATGRPGKLARRLGARRIVDDKLIAAVASVCRTDPQRDLFLRMTATDNGWWYRSDGPAGDTRVALVGDPQHGSGRPRELCSALRQILKELPNCQFRTASTRMHVMDASSARLDRCAADRWCAVGDAGTAFDPFCGQGLSQAFGSALAAAHAIRERAGGNQYAMAAYDHAMQSTYGHSRAQLDFRYAYRNQCSPSGFWSTRASAASGHSRSA